MDSEIERFCQRCEGCQLAAKVPPKCPLQPWPDAEKPWQRLHLDFAGAVNELNKLFNYFGLPETIVSDNGSQFTSSTFRTFCEHHGIQQKFSSPYHPQSNGQAERFVDTIKRALLEAEGEETPVDIIQHFLTAYRATPNRNTPGGISPAECMFGRKIRTRLNNIRPSPVTSASEVRRAGYAQCIRRFNIGDSVLARDFRSQDKWTPVVISKRNGKRTYARKCKVFNWHSSDEDVKNAYQKALAEKLPSGPVLLKKQQPASKYDPVVEEGELPDCNPQCAHVRLPNGKEEMVSMKDPALRGEPGDLGTSECLADANDLTLMT
ncbi:uncharacterized protein DEA37_0003174 [Paragonimus westermani]|uniref:Integrase catalytic domain-containing protein n=1 Tax=Paragonimus westermani TaxID=34504 RepID=A0A5J4NGW4_9TREM|nr:uncharacterized protein DEA37_0003174 [Paragonimus westermani]